MAHINTVPIASPYTTRLSKTLLSIRNSQNLSLDSGSGNTVELSKQSAEATADSHALMLLGFAPNSDFIVVLGRLFKLHPEFDELLITLLLDLYIRDFTVRDSEGTTKGTYIVLIAESLYDLNTIVSERLERAMHTRMASINRRNVDSNSPYGQITAEQLLAKYVRLVGYAHYYTVLRSARVVLDTYPYGGILYF